MDYTRIAQPWKACAKASEGLRSRFGMHNLRLSLKAPAWDVPIPGEKHGVLCATNGRILAVHEVTLDDQDAEGWITPEACKAAEKCKNRSGDAIVLANGSLRVPFAGVEFQRPDPKDGEYPRVEGVQWFPSGEDGEVSISLNADYLKALADALGTGIGEKAVTLTFRTPQDKRGAPIHVAAVANKRAHGWIMPIIVDD